MSEVGNKTGRKHYRRPLFAVAVFFALGIVLGRFVYLQTLYITAAAVFAVAAYFLRKKNILLLVCLASAFLAAFLSANAVDVSYVKTGDSLKVEGRVYNEPYKNDYGSTICFLDDASVGGVKCANIKLYISDDNDIKCGDTVTATADIELPGGVKNPGGFDEKLYLLTQGISYKAYADTAQATGESGSFTIFFTKTSRYLCDTIDSIFDADTAPLAKAMLLGDTDGIDEQTITAFKDTGMAHVLAVSGLNATILIASIFFVLKALKVGRTPRLIAALAFVAVYTCVTGLSPSIVRAAIMSSAVLLGTHFGKQNDILNYFSLAFIVSLLLRPLDLFTAGFQLSYGAVFGMITLGAQIKIWWDRAFSKRLPKFADKLMSGTGNTLSASIGATAGTAPILASSFNRVSTLSILINLAVIPLASAATVLVFIAALFGIILGPAASFAAFPAAVVIRVILAIVKWAAGIPFVAFNVMSPPLYMMIAFFAILFISSKYLLIKTKLKSVICASLCVAAVAMAFALSFHGLYVAFLDIGQGDAAFVKTQQGGEYFFDGGREASENEVVDFTQRNGYTPDAAFVSHTDADHFSGIVALYNAGLLKKVYCSYQEQNAVQKAMPGAQVVPLSAGDTVMLDDCTKALILYPYKDTVSDGENDLSLVVRVSYNGHSALFTGDISGGTETDIFADQNKVDIYEAAHHGSKGSSYRLPLSVLTPEYAVISVGKNTYGQPNPIAVKNLEDYSGKVYNTMSDYCVEFYIGKDITVNTYGG